MARLLNGFMNNGTGCIGSGYFLKRLENQRVMGGKELAGVADCRIYHSRSGIQGNHDSFDDGSRVADLKPDVIPLFGQMGWGDFINDSNDVREFCC